MRLIIGFFVYGFIFYLLWMFYPEVFQTLVSWAAHVYDFFHQIVQSVMEKLSSTPKPAA